MKALVIGGTRYFGKRLVHLLINDGADVTVLNRGQTPDDFGNQVARIKANRSDAKALQEALINQSFDVVIDQVCFTPQDALSACSLFEKKTKRYVLTSTKSTYDPLVGELHEGDFDANLLKIEPSRFKTSYANAYAEGKRLTEAVFAQRAPFPVARVRIPIVLGVDDYTGRLEFHVERIKNAKEIYFPDVDAKICFVNSTDAARFLHFMTHSNFVGPINCASPDAIVLRNLVEYLEMRLHQKTVFAEKATAENQSPFGITADRFMNVHLSQSLGFNAVPLSKWLPELIDATCTK